MTTTLPRPADPAAPAATPGLPVLLSAIFVITLDFFIVNVALPSMTAELAAGSGTVTLWVAGYAIGFSAFIVLGARLGDRWGRRRTFVRGLALFTVASAACGLAPDPTVLVAARVLQGLGAALLSPQVLATITATATGTERTRALSAYGLIAGLAAVSGQLVGGVLVQADVAGLGWRGCFLVNVPVGLAAIAFARTVPETRTARRLAIDGPSVATLALGLGALVLGLTEGQARHWPLWCLVLLVAAVDLLLAFALRQRALVRRGEDPLVDLRLLGERTFGLGAGLCFVLQTVVASSFFVLALALQGGIGLDALQAGLVFTALATSYVVVSSRATALLARYGATLLVAGAVVTVAGELALVAAAGSVTRGAGVAGLLPGLVVVGAGMGLLFSPSVSVALAGVDGARAGEASGVVSTLQQAGGAIGVALLGVVFYGALDGGYADAFAVASWCLAGQAALVGAIALRLRS